MYVCVCVCILITYFPHYDVSVTFYVTFLIMLTANCSVLSLLHATF